MDNNINFKANYVKPAIIKKLEKGCYKPFQASIVELEKSDISSIKEVSKIWGQSISAVIATDAHIVLNRCDSHLYALTTQKDKFNNLVPEKVLALVDFSEGSICNHLNYIQVKPNCISTRYGTFWESMKNRVKNIFSKPKNEYKHVGKEMVNMLKEKSEDKCLELVSYEEAKNFYKKLGFRLDRSFGAKANAMIWTPSKKDYKINDKF